MEGKFIGLILAICSSILIGVSFVITKKGLQRSSSDQGRIIGCFRLTLLPKNPIWWIGLITMVGGELLNFVGYTFAPAILITPLGALSVIIGAGLASIFLKERLGPTGIVGCLLSLIGAVIIVLHSPEDPVVESVDELVSYMLQPGFITYFVLVVLVTIGLIWKAVPRWGKVKPIVYISICSLTGSLSIMTIKAFGIAVKLTIAGNNQFTQASTYIFGLMCVAFILVQMNYFNKALDTFSTNVVNPIYFVFFTTATIAASAIMYRGWHTSDAVNTVTMVCGFLIIFSGVYLLNSIAKKSQTQLTTDDTNAAPSVVSVIPGTLSASFTVSRTSMIDIGSTTVNGTDSTEPTYQPKYDDSRRVEVDEEKKIGGSDIDKPQRQYQRQRHLHAHRDRHNQNHYHYQHQNQHQHQHQNCIQRSSIRQRQRQRAHSLP
ncbi:magnesium transporter NIPA-domain-containing protein [Absidia repens]|uniref:Magnesium transporter NIPA-domain-containing protein n=1 Tax=Absidia repens TaxID=90262 RepID=A0A1X2HX81_9FUNG|nr:magnesium transporter NIPA-domain-containing protein [Absidia repens]